MPVETAVALRDLTFSYDAASQPLFAGLSMHLPAGFTGVVGANGAGKTTLLRVLAGELMPVAGDVQGATGAVYCAQRTDAPPRDLKALLDAWDGDACALRGRLGIAPDYLDRWETLSHGERKRVQIGCALWQRPTLLAIDEPTNHLDTPARALLIDALQRFRGVGVIVSHDRALLDALCVQCLWLEPPEARVYRGGYSAAHEQRQAERSRAIAARAAALRVHRALEQEVAVRRRRAAREHVDRSKRGLSRKDSDARAKIDHARLTDGKAGAALRQLEGRAAQARARLDAARVDKVHETGIWLPGSRSRRDRLLALEPGTIPLGGGRTLAHPRLAMAPHERIAITGDNGTGKSTLIARLLHESSVPREHVVVMPQELTPDAGAHLLDAARALPPERLGHVMTVVSRLGSRPERLLASSAPSPGEIRKLLLALGVAATPHLIVLDEPTNHLDLPSIEALEAALQDCPCGILLVSHDAPFRERLTGTRWHLQVDRGGDVEVRVS